MKLKQGFSMLVLALAASCSNPQASLEISSQTAVEKSDLVVSSNVEESLSSELTSSKQSKEVCIYQMYYDKTNEKYWQRRFDKCLKFEDGYELTKAYVRERLSYVYSCNGDGSVCFSDIYMDEAMTIIMEKAITITKDIELFFYCMG